MLHCRRLTQRWPRSGPILRSTPRLGARALNGDSKLPNPSLFQHSHGFPLNNIPLLFVVTWIKCLLFLFALIEQLRGFVDEALIPCVKMKSLC
jgi:hypothetical protein